MNTNNFNLIRRTVVAQSTTNDEELLEQLRITSNKDIPQIDFLIRKDGKPCFLEARLM